MKNEKIDEIKGFIETGDKIPLEKAKALYLGAIAKSLLYIIENGTTTYTVKVE